MKLALSARADAELEAVFRTSIAIWGEMQARRYAERIDARLILLLQFPNAGRDRTDLGAGVRSMPVGAHIVYYKAESDTLLILSVRDARRRPAQTAAEIE